MFCKNFANHRTGVVHFLAGREWSYPYLWPLNQDVINEERRAGGGGHLETSPRYQGWLLIHPDYDTIMQCFVFLINFKMIISPAWKSTVASWSRAEGVMTLHKSPDSPLSWLNALTASKPTRPILQVEQTLPPLATNHPAPKWCSTNQRAWWDGVGGRRKRIGRIGCGGPGPGLGRDNSFFLISSLFQGELLRKKRRIYCVW